MRISSILLLFGLPFFLGLFPTAQAPAASLSSSHWWGNAVFYEVFVRSFQDSNGDGKGDLNGLRSRLDYLQHLGVDAIWLMPIFSSPSYHGYDTIDYRSINPDYGSLDDFKKLLVEAHARGMRVILDLAVNHTSDQAAAFQAGMQNARSPLKDWYLWSSQPLSPWVGMGHFYAVSPERYYYASFSKNMPDLNWQNSAVRAEVKSILHYWSELGADGFRLDAARYYVKGPEGEADTPGTHFAIEEFAQDLRRDFPNSFFVGEVWADAATIAPYLNSGRELDQAFNFPEAFGLETSLEKESGEAFSASLRTLAAQIKNQNALAPFLTNHDMQRIASRLAGNVQKLKLGAAALLTLPGTPFLYYGEEIGLPNGASARDEDKRSPMQWDRSEGMGFTKGAPWWPFSTKDPGISVNAELGKADSLLETYRKWIQLRRATPALHQGGMHLLNSSDAAAVAFARTTGEEKVVVVLNFSAATLSELSVDLTRFSDFPLGKAVVPVTEARSVRVRKDSNGLLQSLQLLQVPAFSATVVQLDQ
jgi:alpha-amylase